MLISVDRLVHCPGLRGSGRVRVTHIVVSTYLPTHHVRGTAGWLIESLWGAVTTTLITKKFTIQTLTFGDGILAKLIKSLPRGASWPVLRVQGGEGDRLARVIGGCEVRLEGAPVVRCSTGA